MGIDLQTLAMGLTWAYIVWAVVMIATDVFGIYDNWDFPTHFVARELEVSWRLVVHAICGIVMLLIALPRTLAIGALIVCAIATVLRLFCTVVRMLRAL